MCWGHWPWARWLGLTVAYALVVTGLLFLTQQPDLERFMRERGLGQVAAGGVFIVLVLLAVGIGVHLRHWSWTFGPLVAFLIPVYISFRLDYEKIPPVRRGEGAAFSWLGFVMAIFLALGLSAAAGAGVWWGKQREERSRAAIDRVTLPVPPDA